MVEALARDADAVVDAAAGDRSQLGRRRRSRTAAARASATCCADALRLTCGLLDSPLPPELARHYITLPGGRRQACLRPPLTIGAVARTMHDTDADRSEERSGSASSRPPTAPSRRARRAGARSPAHAGRRAQPGARRPGRAGQRSSRCSGRKAILVPILLGVMFSYALTPAVDRLQRWRVPRALGAGAGAERDRRASSAGARGRSPTMRSALIETLPQVAQKVRHGLEGQGRKPRGSRRSTRCSRPPTSSSRRRSRPTPSDRGIGGVGRRRRRLRRARRGRARAGAATSGATTTSTPAPITPSTPRAVTRVVVERPAFNIRDYLWTGTIGLFAFLGQLRGRLLRHAVPARLGRHLPAQDGQARRAAPQPEEDHDPGARRSQRADPALPARAAGDQRRRRRRHRARVPRARPQQRRRSGASSPAVTNLVPYVGAVAGRRRLGAGRLHPVRQHRQGARRSAPARSRSTPSSATC